MSETVSTLLMQVQQCFHELLAMIAEKDKRINDLELELQSFKSEGDPLAFLLDLQKEGENNLDPV